MGRFKTHDERLRRIMEKKAAKKSARKNQPTVTTIKPEEKKCLPQDSQD